MIVRIMDEEGEPLEEIQMSPRDVQAFVDLIEKHDYVDKEGSFYSLEGTSVEPRNVFEIRLKLE